MNSQIANSLAPGYREAVPTPKAVPIPKVVPHVQNQIDHLVKHLEEIDVAVSRLEERISGVLMSPNPAPTQDEQNRLETVPVAELLSKMNTKCSQIIQRIESIVERCQL